jgi:uncharacterized protein YjiS (DUF1127 family)
MSTMIPNARRVLADLEHGFAAWLQRANSRNELHNLSDRDLRDIGLCRPEARWESSKPFWMA